MKMLLPKPKFTLSSLTLAFVLLGTLFFGIQGLVPEGRENASESQAKNTAPPTTELVKSPVNHAHSGAGLDDSSARKTAEITWNPLSQTKQQEEEQEQEQEIVLPQYASFLPTEERGRLEAVLHRYPRLEITETGDYHKILFEQRNSYPSELSGPQKQMFIEELTKLEKLHEAAVSARVATEGLKLKGVNESGVPFTIIAFNSNDEPVYLQPQNANAAISTAASYVREQSTFDPTFGPYVNGSGFQVNVNDSSIIYSPMALG